MKINKETQESIQELQSLEQNYQAMSMQKQAFQIEVNEAENALQEIGKTKDEVYRITGQVMLRASKEEIERELKEKIQVLGLRLKSIEKQESLLREKIEKLRQELAKNLGK